MRWRWRWRSIPLPLLLLIQRQSRGVWCESVLVFHCHCHCHCHGEQLGRRCDPRHASEKCGLPTMATRTCGAHSRTLSSMTCAGVVGAGAGAWENCWGCHGHSLLGSDVVSATASSLCCPDQPSPALPNQPRSSHPTRSDRARVTSDVVLFCPGTPFVRSH